MAEIALKAELLRWAGLLRPVGKPFLSVLKIASDLGTVVSLRVHTDCSRPTAQIDFRQCPAKIVLFRQGRAEGEQALGAHEENLLTSRERFSVAHELGHWIALSRLGIGVQTDKKAYWDHEHAVNAFAGSLLAPDWLVANWLKRMPEGVAVSPFSLKYWADSECRVSEEVIAKRLAGNRSSIGFLRVQPVKRARDRAEILRVICSAAGDALRLPGERAYVDAPELFGLIKSSKVGEACLSGVRLGRCEPQDLQIAWRRGKPILSEPTMWISLVLVPKKGAFHRRYAHDVSKSGELPFHAE